MQFETLAQIAGELASLTLIAAVIAAIVTDAARKWRWVFAILSVTSLIFTCIYIVASPKCVESITLLSLLGLHFKVVLDPVSKVFALNIALLGIAAIIASVRYVEIYESSIPYNTVLLAFVYFMICVAAAPDWLWFMFMWESMTLASYILIVYEHTEERVRAAAFKYFVTCHIGSGALLIGIVAYYVATGTFSYAALTNASPYAAAVVALMIFGFMTKAGLFPMHFWLPDAHPAAPSPVSALLSGAMVELGIYGAYRLIAPLSYSVYTIAAVVTILAIISVFGAIVMYWYEKDVKRLFAWSTIENIGWMFLLVAVSCMCGLNFYRDAAAYVLNHGAAKAAAFLATGYLLYVYGTRDINALKGLAHRDRIGFLLFTGSIFALEGVPPFNMFYAKLQTIIDMFRAGFWYIGVALAAGWCIAFIYFLILFQKMLTKEAAAEAKRRAPPSVYIPPALMIVLALFTNYIALTILGGGW